MIFVTVGSDLPFDRLIRHVDEWASVQGRSDVFAQIGNGAYTPEAIPFSRFLEPADFNQRMAGASAIVAHAGIGTILSALRLQKPIIVFPRRTAFREVRNEHQLATARHLLKSKGIHVAMDVVSLIDGLNNLNSVGTSAQISEFASEQLLDCVRDFIADSADSRRS